MEQSIFTRIINGEIPCHKIYEDDKTFAFLDIHPVQPGHILVIPKQQIDHFEDMPQDVYQAVWNAVKLVAVKQKEVLARQRVAVIVLGTDVPHVHVHLIPFDNGKEIYSTPVGTGSVADDNELAALAIKLKIGENDG